MHIFEKRDDTPEGGMVEWHTWGRNSDIGVFFQNRSKACDLKVLGALKACGVQRSELPSCLSQKQSGSHSSLYTYHKTQEPTDFRSAPSAPLFPAKNKSQCLCLWTFWVNMLMQIYHCCMMTLLDTHISWKLWDAHFMTNADCKLPHGP